MRLTRPPRVFASALSVVGCLVLVFAVATQAVPTRNVASATACSANTLRSSSWLDHAGVDVRPGGECASAQPNDGFTPSFQASSELASRLYRARHWASTQPEDWRTSKSLEDSSSTLRFHPSEAGYEPVAGDVIVFAATHLIPSGHVAIVDSRQNDQLTVVEQTALGPVRYSLPVSNGRLGGNVEGIVHSSMNAGPPPDVSVVIRMSDGQVLAKSRGGSFVPLKASAEQVEVARSESGGLIIAVRQADGTVLIKHGIGGPWLKQSLKARSIALAEDDLHGSSLAIITPRRHLYLDAGLRGRFVKKADGVRSVSLASSRRSGPILAIVDTKGTAMVKTGTNGTWNSVRHGARAVRIAASSGRGYFVAVLAHDRQVYLRSSQNEEWTRETTSALDFALTSSSRGRVRLVVLRRDERLSVKEGMTGRWSVRARDVQSMAVGTTRNGDLALAAISARRLEVSVGHAAFRDVAVGGRGVALG